MTPTTEIMQARQSLELYLYKKYNRMALTLSEVGQEIPGLSEDHIYAMLSRGELENLPKFRRSSGGAKATYFFPVPYLAEFLIGDEA